MRRESTNLLNVCNDECNGEIKGKLLSGNQQVKVDTNQLLILSSLSRLVRVSICVLQIYEFTQGYNAGITTEVLTHRIQSLTYTQYKNYRKRVGMYE